MKYIAIALWGKRLLEMEDVSLLTDKNAIFFRHAESHFLMPDSDPGTAIASVVTHELNDRRRHQVSRSGDQKSFP